jgi:hypothetical protein
VFKKKLENENEMTAWFKNFMRKLFCYYIIITLILLNACKSSDTNLYEFDPRTLKENEITLSEIAEDISYIPFESNFPLNRIGKIIVTMNAVYLNSRDIGILKFSRNGKFICKVGSIGRGPGEYRFYLIYCVNDQSGRVYNVSDQNEHVQVFSGTGQLDRSFSLKEYGTSISSIDYFDSKLFVQCNIHYENADYEWIVYDTLGNIIKKQTRHLPKFATNVGSVTNPYLFRNTLSYFNAWSDTVFTVLPDLTERPSIIISPGEHRYPRSYIPIEQIMQKKYSAITKIFETKRFIIIKYFYQKYSLAFIDKANRETYLNFYDYDETGGYPGSGITNDLDGGLWFLPETYFTEKGREYLVGLQYPYQIRKLVASDDFRHSTHRYPEKKKELEKLAANLKETDNPVLVLVKLK